MGKVTNECSVLVAKTEGKETAWKMWIGGYRNGSCGNRM
jgi:hypothetical protein